MKDFLERRLRVGLSGSALAEVKVGSGETEGEIKGGDVVSWLLVSLVSDAIASGSLIASSRRTAFRAVSFF